MKKVILCNAIRLKKVTPRSKLIKERVKEGTLIIRMKKRKKSLKKIQMITTTETTETTETMETTEIMTMMKKSLK